MENGMAYARRRTTKRRSPTPRYRATARRSYTATRRRKSTARRSTGRSQQTVVLRIEHQQPSDIQRPMVLMAQADKKDRNQRRTF